MAAIEAAPTVTPKDTESCTSSGSITRMLAADAKAATDRKTIASVEVARGGTAVGDMPAPLPGWAGEGKVVRS